jgi:hypothetical protein
MLCTMNDDDCRSHDHPLFRLFASPYMPMKPKPEL